MTQYGTLVSVRLRYGVNERTYRNEYGIETVTYELPEYVVNRVQWPRVKAAIQAFVNRRNRINRQARVLELLAEGVKVPVIAQFVGLHESQVYRIKYAGKAGAKTFGAKAPK